MYLFFYFYLFIYLFFTRNHTVRFVNIWPVTTFAILPLYTTKMDLKQSHHDVNGV